MASIEDDEYEIPLRDQRYFGAGIKRKRIQFVPSTSEKIGSTASLPATPSTSAADRYLSIVLKNQNRSAPVTPTSTIAEAVHEAENEGATQTAPTIESSEDDLLPAKECAICRKPISNSVSRAHETSIVHQICLQHSHPPSNVDRKRKGFAVLENQGWDPDSRLGLGAQGEGRLHPVKATENPQKAGLGATAAILKAPQKPVRLDAGKVKKMDKEGKKKAQDLRNTFYRSEEVEKYLGQEQANPSLDIQAFERSKRRG